MLPQSELPRPIPRRAAITAAANYFPDLPAVVAARDCRNADYPAFVARLEARRAEQQSVIEAAIAAIPESDDVELPAKLAKNSGFWSSLSVDQKSRIAEYCVSIREAADTAYATAHDGTRHALTLIITSPSPSRAEVYRVEYRTGAALCEADRHTLRCDCAGGRTRRTVAGHSDCYHARLVERNFLPRIRAAMEGVFYA